MIFHKKILHIETTNRCTLKCPACPRTVWQNLIKQPIKKQDLNIKELQKFLDCDAGEKIETFLLCGDYGDTIYYPDLFELIKTFRHKKFEIRTNGSYRNKEWWGQLNNMLNENDTVVFGIDGLYQENKKYRINSDWSSIETAIETLSKGKAKLMCQTIIFNFNYKKLDQIKQWAENNGLEWFAMKTSRFGDQALIPADKEIVDVKEMYQEAFEKKEPINIVPRCLEASVITSEGYFMLCDWIRNPLTFYRSELYLDRQKWIDRLKISDINLNIAYEVLNEWIENVKIKAKNGQAEVLCKMKCRK